MRPMNRRRFLAAAVATVAGGCAGGRAAPSTATTSGTSEAGATATIATAPVPTTGPATTTTHATTTTAVPTTEPPPASTATQMTPAPLEPVEFGDPFTLGIASGDPDAAGVVLWTRLAPDPLHGGGMPDGDVVVRWEASRDEAFGRVDRWGDEVATAAHGHSVHAVAALDQGEWFYRFRAGQHTSAVGRTTTAPPPNEPVAAVTFASASCQNYEAGFYAAHRDLAEQRPAFVVWLGDYIYEGAAGGAGSVRSHTTPEPADLAGYRDRYALYKTDADLQAAHRACPWFVIWDDHEVEDNYAGASPKNEREAAAFPARRAAAYQAWWEHMPVRLPAPGGTDDYRIYRDVQWGDLIGIALLDGRQYRTDQACGDVRLDLGAACAGVVAPGRTMLGDAQEQWLDQRLRAWGTTWNVLGNQTVMTDVTVAGAVLNYDQWDGYPAQRARILEHIGAAAVGNLVVLTGDIHVAVIGELRVDHSDAPVGVEFVCSSISSGSSIDPGAAPAFGLLRDIVDAELEHRGYVLHTVTAAQWRAEYRIVADARRPGSAVSTHGTYAVDAGTSVVRLLSD